MQELAGSCEGVQSAMLGDTGLEHPVLKPPKTAISKIACAESGALDARRPPSDPDLARLVEAWPHFPDHIKAQITNLIREHGGDDHE